MSNRPELTQFDSAKSMIRYLPPYGTAGLARCADRIDSRSPCPPARITTTTSRPLRGVRMAIGPSLFAGQGTGVGIIAPRRYLSTLRRYSILR